MTRYVVLMRWEYEVEARSPREAIESALERSKRIPREAVTLVQELVAQAPVRKTVPPEEYALDQIAAAEPK